MKKNTPPNKARAQHVAREKLGRSCERKGARRVAGASTGRNPRGQRLTTPRIRAPAPPTAPTWLSATVATRSWNIKPRAYTITRLPPAPQRPRWGSGCGCSLYPPPPRSPRLAHAPPRLQQPAALTWPSATVATRQPE
eukprot:scaffold8599_cov110-Isochrysis_galbana.AAC.2